jgi:inhibitor of cysteine peptidase
MIPQVAGALLIMWACEASPPCAQPSEIRLTEGQTGSTVELAAGQMLNITLPTQGGTGFSWDLAGATGAPVRLVRSDTRPAQDRNLPGGPELQSFVFEPIAAGSGDIEFGYRRPWEKNTPPARTFVVHVVVR